VRIGIVAGEASGDLLAAGLIREIRRQIPDVSFEGVAGPLMQGEGCEVWEQAEALSVMGLVEPILEIPRLLKLRRTLAERWIASPPDVFVGVDAPDFNLGLEKRLRQAGIATVHYVSPSVWAWRKYRVRKIRSAADKVLCLLPFEKKFYDRQQVSAEFVGHPLADRFADRCADRPVNDTDRTTERSRLGLTAARVVAVMPGSRSSEVARLGPVFIAAARQLTERFTDIELVTPLATAKTRKQFEIQLAEQDIEHRFTLLDGNAEGAISAADVVLLASGTAALEAALLQRPMVAAYRLHPLTYFIARTLNVVRLKHFTLPNLLTPQPMVPEFLQAQVTPEALCDAIADLLDDVERRDLIVAEFVELRAVLQRGADARAAAAVLQLVDTARRKSGR